MNISEDEYKLVKIELVMLAEYLQCQPLSDAQILLYARELRSVGVSGLRAAISILKADEALWSGKFPLPAKIKSYLTGSVNEMAHMSVMKILSGSNDLNQTEKTVKKQYGYKAIDNRDTSSTPAIMAQLRDMLVSSYTSLKRNEVIGLLRLDTKDHERVGHAESESVSHGVIDDKAVIQRQSIREEED